MLSTLKCVACIASLQAEDGHDQCPACLCVEHLREAVSDNPCMNCSLMPHALRLATLAEVEGGPGLPPSGVGPSGTRRRASAAGGPPGMSRKVDNLANQVDTLSNEVAQIKALLQNLQPAQGVQATPVTLRLRNLLTQRMTCCPQLRPVVTLQWMRSL